MKTRLILVRHGYSITNDLKYFTGNTDIPLTGLGRNQAEKCAEYLKDYPIDFIYSSDLSRAMDTAKPVSALLNLPIHPAPALREINAGKWEGTPFTELEKQFPESYRMWKENIGLAVCDGGESVQAFSERIMKGITEIAVRHIGSTVLITTHATPIRVLCTHASGLPIARMCEIPWVKNASISIFEYEDGKYRIVQKDFAGHLGDMMTGLPKNV
ncbi:MAG: histidine phosphatase family protein [Clostridia bacterium]|nr:histidine phosphatase family protein [Clostridia bacterium]